MNTTTTTSPDDYALQNAKVLSKYSNRGMRIEHFTSGLGNDGSGFVPGLSGTEEAASIADLISTIANQGNSEDVAAELRALVTAL